LTTTYSSLGFIEWLMRLYYLLPFIAWTQIKNEKLQKKKSFWDDVKKDFLKTNTLKNYWIFNFAKRVIIRKNKVLILKNNSSYNISYSGTSLGKYINIDSMKGMSIYFLRKTRMFNKGRYSRNRQNYRTGVYWCLYINIMVLFGLYFYFYRFTLNFGYLWWLLFSLLGSFFVPRMVKFRLYNPRIFLQTLIRSKPLIFYNFNLKDYSEETDRDY
jgi:hypothetical protein